MSSWNQSRYPGFNGEQYYSPYQFHNSPFSFGPSHPSDMGCSNPTFVKKGPVSDPTFIKKGSVPGAKKFNAQEMPKSRVIPVFDARDIMQNEKKEPDKTQHGSHNNKPQGKKIKIVSMSRDEAADRIWAAYQGYRVRRTRPLQQLRLIQNVRSRLNEFKSSASDPNHINKAREDSRERLLFTEGLMCLLLQLDALQQTLRVLLGLFEADGPKAVIHIVQGVHPFVRELRKGLTREIVQLQENIDAMLQGAKLKQVQDEVPMAVTNDVESSKDASQHNEVQQPLPQQDHCYVADDLHVADMNDVGNAGEASKASSQIPEQEKVLTEVPGASSSSMMHEYRDVMKQLVEDNQNMKMLLQQYMEKIDWQNFMIVNLSERMANLEKRLNGNKHTKRYSTCTTGKKYSKQEKDESAKSA